MAVSGAAAQTEAGGIVAVVNNDVVSRLDVDARTKLVVVSSQLPRNAETVRRVRQQVLRNLIDEKLRLQEADRLKITVSRDEINRAMADIEQRNRMRPGGLKKALERDGLDISALTSRLKAEIAWAKIVGRHVNRRNITDEQIDEAIKQIEAGKGLPEYLVAEIYIPFDTAKPRSETQQTIRKLVGQLRQGADFESLAQTFSQSTSAAQGGNLGWMRADQLDRTLAGALAQMKVGQIAGPIEATDGYYVLYLKNRRVARGVAGGDDTLELQLVMEPLDKGTPETELHAKAAAAAQATQAATSCKQLIAVGKQAGLTQDSHLSDVKTAALTPELRRSIASLPVGKASKPLVTGTRMIVAMVCSRRTASREKERDQVAQRLTRQRAELVARSLMRNLRRRAFIDIRR